MSKTTFYRMQKNKVIIMKRIRAPGKKTKMMVQFLIVINQRIKTILALNSEFCLKHKKSDFGFIILTLNSESPLKSQ